MSVLLVRHGGTAVHIKNNFDWYTAISRGSIRRISIAGRGLYRAVSGSK